MVVSLSLSFLRGVFWEGRRLGRRPLVSSRVFLFSSVSGDYVYAFSHRYRLEVVKGEENVTATFNDVRDETWTLFHYFYAWVPSYLLSDSFCFSYDSFHFFGLMNGYSVRTEDGVCFVSKTRKGRVVPVPLPHSPGPPACTNEPLRFTQQRCNCIRNPIFSIKIRDTVSKSRLRTAIRLNPLFEFLEFRVYRYRGSFFFLIFSFFIFAWVFLCWASSWIKTLHS